MQTVDDFEDVQQSYRDFARNEVELSACFSRWAAAVAEDPEIVALLATLPPGKRQPNLVFAAARWNDSGTGPYDDLRTTLLSRWQAVRDSVLARSTQTNEVGRCAALIPLLAHLPQPLALLEVGASAGLCLFPDRYSYRYSNGAALDPADGVSPVVLPCEISGSVPVPQRLPEIAWRRGIDLNPLNAANEDSMAWLEALVWPEHEDRRLRLAAAISMARQNPPTLVAGDLIETVGDVAATAPSNATLIVFTAPYSHTCRSRSANRGWSWRWRCPAIGSATKPRTCWRRYPQQPRARLPRGRSSPSRSTANASAGRMVMADPCCGAERASAGRDPH